MDPLNRTTGYDIDGNPVSLGDTDSSGREVGYIDLAGTAWESLEERDIATTCGRYLEAWNRWNRTGGLLGKQPDPREIALRECYDLDNVEVAAEEAARETDPEDLVTQMRMKMNAMQIQMRASLQ
jgi:hypothetical protein